MNETPAIDRFSGEYAFLSNFHTEADGTTVEHRFQAAKALDPTEQTYVLSAPTRSPLRP